MPELPDIEAYRFALERTIGGRTLQWIRLHHPFLLRSVHVPPDSAVGRTVTGIHRFGKRISIEFEGGVNFVFHLMIAGRFKWKDGEIPEPGAAKPAGKGGALAALGFDCGVLSLTEAGSKRRASLHVAGSTDEARAMDRGGLEVLDPSTTEADFAEAIRSESHTLKRTLTDPRLFSGIGNSYSDEILFAARLSPFLMTRSITDEQISELFRATRQVLTEWRDRLIAEAAKGFPTKVTAFRPEMHVHGKYDTPCDVCGTPVQRIRYAENECNYCPSCQTGGKLYADRALSRLLRDDWPRTVEELENLRRPPGT